MIPYGKQQVTQSDLDAVSETLRSDFLTGGPAVTEFERKLTECTGARYAIACSNGTAALHIACLALGIGPPDLGVTSPITFLASANCLEFCGARSDFIDIDERLCMSPALLERYCKEVEVPRVVIPVDFAGVPSNLAEIARLREEYGFSIISDCAHALGSTFEDAARTRHAGDCEFADLTILSFHPVKTITTAEGGAVLTNDEGLAKRARLFRSHGMVRNREEMQQYDGGWYYEMHSLGFNYRITDMQCALGLSQLSRLADFKDRRQDIVRRYNQAFEGATELTLPPWPQETSPCFHLYPLRFKEGPKRRKMMYDFLASREILCQVHYIPVYWQPYYASKYGYGRGKCPRSEAYYGMCLSLPLFPALRDSDVELICKTVLEGLARALD